ncbi:MAG: hypothetical protein HOO06_11015, partial [Bdellovibrionaceae bacterium]|nr:hypothetical protein [Pseudobdellovibrionaceae bacterium]
LIVTSGGVTTSSGDSADMTFNQVIGTLASYTLTLDEATKAAGTSTTASLTAKDAAANTLTGIDGTLDTNSFTFSTNANVDAPNSTQTGNGNDPANGTLTFTSGVATLTYTFFNDDNNVAISDLTVTDTTNTIVTNNSDTMAVTPAVSDHFEITNSGFAVDADGAAKGTTSATITLYDEYDNDKVDAGITAATVALQRVSGYTNTGTLNAATSDSGGQADVTSYTLDFSGSSVQSLYDFAYDVGHVAELIVTSGGVTTSSGDSADMTFNQVIGTLASYTLTLDEATKVAGTSTTASLTAKDAAANTLTGIDGTLDTNSFTFSTNANVDAPNSTQTGNGNDPANGTLTFTSGVATLTYTFFNDDNNVSVSDLTVTDTTNTIVTNNSDTMAVTPAASDHFEITNAGFAVDADASVQGATSATVTLYDQYDNDKVDAGMTAATVSVQRVSGYTNIGTLNGATTNAGGQADVTGYTLDFSGASAQSLYDFAYDVGHVAELIVTSGGVTTSSGDSADMTFNTATGTVQSYTLTLDDASKTAGVTTAATLTALDGGSNIINADDAILNTINFSFTTSANVDAPDASETGAANDPATGTLTFTSGAASLNYIFFNAANNVSVSDLTVNDTTNTLAVNNSDTLTVDPTTEDRLVYSQGDGQSATVDTAVATAPRVQILDDYGNPVSGVTVNFAITDALPLSGSLGAASDITDASGYASVTYTLGQTVGTNTMRASAGGLTGAPTLYDFSETGTVDAADHLTFTTEPTANETQNNTFGTQPVVEIRDQFENVRTGDNASVVTLTAYLGAGCSAGAVGSLTNNTDTVSAGIATFTTLQHSGAETISVEATLGGSTADCSTTTQVYTTMSIDNDPAGNLNTGDAHRFEVTGGVPPLTFSVLTNNSGSSIGGAYTGGLCTGGKICGDYTAGMTGGAVVDTIQVTDSSAGTNGDTSTATVDGAAFTNTGDSVAYGSNAGDLSRTFTVNNGGNATSGAITVTFTPDNGSYWTKTSDLCDTVDLGTSSTCNISVTYLGTAASAGAHTATLTVTGASGGTITLNLTASTP